MSKPIALSPAQARHIERLVLALGQAEAARDVAQEKVDAAQANANAFVLYCAEELKVDTRTMRFDQTQMRFVPVEKEG